MGTVSDDYWLISRQPDEILIRYHRVGDAPLEVRAGEFRVAAGRAAFLLRNAGLQKGEFFALGFGENTVEDLAFRMGAARLGAIPVTVNWQADTKERILFKLQSTGAKAWVAHSSFQPEFWASFQKNLVDKTIIQSEVIWDEATECDDREPVALSEADPRLVLFTSGTTGTPKAVVHSCENYRQNKLCFESFLEVAPESRIVLAAVNPLHHANSSAIADWALRRPNTTLELFSRYSRTYWERLTELGRNETVVIAPLVSRHFDILESLLDSGEWTIQREVLCESLRNIEFLLGSAPVGPTTVKRLLRLIDKTPTVRFGSTELCLQTIGIPKQLSSVQRLEAFERGWDQGSETQAPGYYIGRPHLGFTQAKVVEEIRPSADGYMKDVPEGQPGYLVVKSSSAMLRYHGQPEATDSVWQNGWYTGLGDVAFGLRNSHDSQLDFYWVSRVSGLLIRGGANYSCEQIATDVAGVIHRTYGLTSSDVDVAVVALKLSSEHEDDCCGTIECRSSRAKGLETRIIQELQGLCSEQLSKSGQLNWLRAATIPRNFKGAVLIGELEKQFQDWLQNQAVHEEKPNP